MAVAAPDKQEVWPVWRYRWDELSAMGVTVRTGVKADAVAIRDFAPDFIVMATGSVPRDPVLDTRALAPEVAVMHAWDAFSDPSRFASGALITVIGAGMVGVELADLLRVIGCRVQVLEVLPVAASGMARNNKFELLERLEAAGVRLLTQCRILSLEGRHARIQVGQAEPTEIPVGDALVFATGPRANDELLDTVQSLGIAYARIGDCNAPGDFLAAIRDGWMVGLGIDNQHATRKTP